MLRTLIPCLLLPLLSWGQTSAPEGRPLRLAIAGLNHGHVASFLTNAQRRADVQIVGVYDPDQELLDRYAKANKLAAALLFTDLNKLLETARPEAIATFSDTFSHAAIVEAAAKRHVHVMMEKPLAVSMEHARRIQKAAEQGGIQVIVNYETTWYRSHAEIWKIFKDEHAAGDIRKMVAMDGHQGPKEINVQPEFLAWLTDPAKNGGGALFDFGCYGANLMTWLMDNQRPLKVTAIAQSNKPQTYARVDDEATILLEYPKAQGIIEGSWNWPYGRKDFEVYGEKGYAVATGGDNLRARLANQAEGSRTLSDLPADQRDSISYLMAIVRGKLKPSGLSSLQNNMVVTEILEAGRDSVRTGKTITLGSH